MLLIEILTKLEIFTLQSLTVGFLVMSDAMAGMRRLVLLPPLRPRLLQCLYFFETIGDLRDNRLR